MWLKWNDVDTALSKIIKCDLIHLKKRRRKYSLKFFKLQQNLFFFYGQKEDKQMTGCFHFYVFNAALYLLCCTDIQCTDESVFQKKSNVTFNTWHYFNYFKESKIQLWNYDRAQEKETRRFFFFFCCIFCFSEAEEQQKKTNLCIAFLEAKKHGHKIAVRNTTNLKRHIKARRKRLRYFNEQLGFFIKLR